MPSSGPVHDRGRSTPKEAGRQAPRYRPAARCTAGAAAPRRKAGRPGAQVPPSRRGFGFPGRSAPGFPTFPASRPVQPLLVESTSGCIGAQRAAEGSGTRCVAAQRAVGSTDRRLRAVSAGVRPCPRSLRDREPRGGVALRSLPLRATGPCRPIGRAAQRSRLPRRPPVQVARRCNRGRGSLTTVVSLRRVWPAVRDGVPAGSPRLSGEAMRNVNAVKGRGPAVIGGALRGGRARLLRRVHAPRVSRRSRRRADRSGPTRPPGRRPGRPRRRSGRGWGRSSSSPRS